MAETDIDVAALRRIRFPQINIEFMPDLLILCRQYRLNPWSEHVWAKMVDEREGDRFRRYVFVGAKIDGLRAIASDTGKYSGQDETKFEYANLGTPIKAIATIRRLVGGRSKKFSGEAHWSNFFPDGDVSRMAFWNKMPERMLGKCAEAHALRRAFPSELAGLYTPEEMDQTNGRGGRNGPATPTDSVPDDAPVDKTQLKMRMHEMGIKDEAARDKIIAEFRGRYGHMEDSPLFYWTVLKEILENPAVYGVAA